MRIVIDGDGSPIKETAIEVAKKYSITVLIVTSIAHYTERIYPEYVEILYVDKGVDSADFKIMSLLEASDILVTQDYGLASLALAKATVLHHSGELYTPDNIEILLAQRYLNKKMQRIGKYMKGCVPFTVDQNQMFKNKLLKIMNDNFQKLSEILAHKSVRIFLQEETRIFK